MAEIIPTGYDTVLDQLLIWGRSGLIPNTKVVKSYYPPVKDPVTGAFVLMPATYYVTGDLGDRSRIQHHDIDTLPNTPYAGSSVAYANAGDGSKSSNQVLGDLGILPAYAGTTPTNYTLVKKSGESIVLSSTERGNTGKWVTNSITGVQFWEPGTDGSVAPESGVATGSTAIGRGVSSLYAGPFYSESTLPATPDYVALAAKTAYKGSQFEKIAANVSTQSDYERATKGIRETTAVERFLGNMSVSVPIITNDLEDTKTLYSSATGGEIDPNLPQYVDGNTDDIKTYVIDGMMDNRVLRFSDRTDLDLRPTGVPAAIPGVLNAYLVSTYDRPTTYPKFSYTTPRAKMFDVPDYYKTFRAQYTTATNDTTAAYTVNLDHFTEFLQDTSVDGPFDGVY